jgi:hypothetical protein
MFSGFSSARNESGKSKALSLKLWAHTIICQKFPTDGIESFLFPATFKNDFSGVSVCVEINN